MFDQDADVPPPRSRAAVAAIALAVMAIMGGLLLVVLRPAGDDDRAPADLTADGASIAAPGSTAASTSPPTSEVASTSPPTTAPATTTSSTLPSTMVAATTTVASTTAPTSPPADPGPTTTLAIWALQPIPETAPPNGPGSPQIHLEVFASGVRAVDAQPFFFRTQLLADAWATGDFQLARTIDLRARAGPEYEARFTDLDRSSLILIDAGVSGGSYELLVIEVNVESGGTTTRLHCAQYVSEGTTGNVVRRGSIELGTYDRNVTPEELRSATEVFDGLLDSCTFGLLQPQLS